MTKDYPKKSYSKGTSSWVNTRLAKQNTKLVRESNAASRSRGLIKARLTALTAKVSLMESELASIMEVLDIKNSSGSKRESIQQKLLQMAEALGSEEE